MNAQSPGDRDGGPLVLCMLCIAGFVAALSFFAPSPFYPGIADDLGTSVSVLGQSATLLMVVSAALGLAVGPIGDAYGYRRLLVFGVCAIAIYQLGFAVSPVFGVVLAFTLLGAIGDALVFGLALALASVLFAGPARRRAISWTIASLSVGAIVGVPVMTFAGDALGWRMALGGFGMACLVFAWVLILVLPDDRRRPDHRIRIGDIASAYLPILADPSTLRLLAVTVTRSVRVLGWLTYAGAFLGDELGLSTRNVGFVYMLGGTGATIGSIVAGTRLLDSSPRTVVALTSLGGGALLWIIHSSTSVVLISLLIPIMAALAAVTSVGVATLLAAESPAQAGTTMALNATLMNAGGAVGAALGGMLLAVGGFPALGVGLSLFALASAILAWWPLQQDPATTRAAGG
jgi:DHA1 family inner membrane transport protein